MVLTLESSVELMCHKQREKLFWVSRRANLMCGGNQKGSMGDVVLKMSLRVIRSSLDSHGKETEAGRMRC